MAVVPAEENSLSQEQDDQIFDDKVQVIEAEREAFVIAEKHVPIKVDRW